MLNMPKSASGSVMQWILSGAQGPCIWDPLDFVQPAYPVATPLNRYDGAVIIHPQVLTSIDDIEYRYFIDILESVTYKTLIATNL